MCLYNITVETEYNLRSSIKKLIYCYINNENHYNKTHIIIFMSTYNMSVNTLIHNI